MEKLAVDIEKVLDEFECSQEKLIEPSISNLENIGKQEINHSRSQFNSETNKPLPNNYKRRSFERINIADADFAPNVIAPQAVPYSSLIVNNNNNYNETNQDEIENGKDENNEVEKEENEVEDEKGDEVDKEENDQVEGENVEIKDEYPSQDIETKNENETIQENLVIAFENIKEEVSDSELESYLNELENEINYENVKTENNENEFLMKEEKENCVENTLTKINVLQEENNLKENEAENVDLKSEIAVIEEINENSQKSENDEEKLDSKLQQSNITDYTSISSLEIDTTSLNADEKTKEIPEIVTESSQEDLGSYDRDMNSLSTATIDDNDSLSSILDVPLIDPSQDTIDMDHQNEEFAINLDNESQSNTTNDQIESMMIGPRNDEFNNTDNLNDESQTERPTRPNFLDLSQNSNDDAQMDDELATTTDSGRLLTAEELRLGSEQPFWIPDAEAPTCMQCHIKFNMIKRRHHCRACGRVLCSKCCDMKARLQYVDFAEVRVCYRCFDVLERVNEAYESANTLRPNPNPNNPMEYCSTVPPELQVCPLHQPLPSVLVPVPIGVLKREGRNRNNEVPKQVMFSDGIRPGGDLTELDGQSENRLMIRRPRATRRIGTPPYKKSNYMVRPLYSESSSFIPPTGLGLPPLYGKFHGEAVYNELDAEISDENIYKFSINHNLFVLVKRTRLDCCVHRTVWCMSTEGLACVGQDEISFVIQVNDNEKYPPKDIFVIVNTIFQHASKGNTVGEMSFMPTGCNNLFDTRDCGGFVFIRVTGQCVQKLNLPNPPYLFAILVHRWEIPWARLFPIRLILRLGAEYRYYPSPLYFVRGRPSVFFEIGHTVIRILADFRKYSFTLPSVRGLYIHMQNNKIFATLPRNRYDEVMRALNNTDGNVFALAGNISVIADSHLVCIQSDENDTVYQTQAINIHNKPRQITGASFIVFNGSLKTPGWNGKCTIVEDGLMLQLPNESMMQLRNALRQMQDYSIGCGPNDIESVHIKWVEDDLNFNIGVTSCIDDRRLDGVPSIRVHNGTDYSGAQRLIRWTEVFLIQYDVESSRTNDTVNISRLAEKIARATCVALVPLLDLLSTANLTCIAVRAVIHPERVGYDAGSDGEKLPPLYMRSLDEQLIPVVHEAALSVDDATTPVILELIFRVMEQGNVSI